MKSRGTPLRLSHCCHQLNHCDRRRSPRASSCACTRRGKQETREKNAPQVISKQQAEARKTAQENITDRGSPSESLKREKRETEFQDRASRESLTRLKRKSLKKESQERVSRESFKRESQEPQEREPQERESLKRERERVSREREPQQSLKSLKSIEREREY